MGNAIVGMLTEAGFDRETFDRLQSVFMILDSEDDEALQRVVAFRLEPVVTPADLAAAGRLLSGSDTEWKRPLASALGPLHPAGPRDTLDPRGGDRWSSGQREIPAWVGPALGGLLFGLATDLERDAAAARTVAARVSGR